MIVLGIETSCDETAVSVVEGTGENVKILSNIVSSQIEIHKKYGGVVPEVAAREHVLNMLPVVEEALGEANLTPAPLLNRRGSKGEVDAIAVTIGPGLVTSLIVGVETAKVLSYAWGVPAVAINHIEGHIYANFIRANSKSQETTPNFPALVLTVSGGHNMLVLMEGHGKLKTIGETRDDAAGEAFDKAAAMLGIGYPGGPAIAAKAEKLKVKSEKLKVVLPRPMIDSANFDFSFSGLKTALLYEIKKDKQYKKRIPEYAHEFQQAVIDVLVKKTIKAGKKYGAKTIMLSGGVAANKELRAQLEKEALQNGFQFKMPELAYTTDNAAMIATAGYFKAREKKFTDWRDLKVDCNLEI